MATALSPDSCMQRFPASRAKVSCNVEQSLLVFSSRSRSIMERLTSLTERLLDLVFAYPVLYDSNNVDFKNIPKKDRAWEEIGTELKVSGGKVKKKWKNLRDSYMKYIKSQMPSAGHTMKNYQKWPWAPQMERFKSFFLIAKTTKKEAVFTNKNSETDIPETGNDESDCPSAVSLMDQPEAVRSSQYRDRAFTKEPPTKKRRHQTSARFDNKVVQFLERKNKPQLDATDHLMLAYAKTIKTFSRLRQAEIKLKIAHLINKSELDQLQDDCLSTDTTE